MPKEFWETLKDQLHDLYCRAKLVCGEDKITIQVELVKRKLMLVVYINGVMKGSETEENQKKYWCLTQKSWYPQKFIKSQEKLIKKVFAKDKAKTEIERLHKKIVYYLPVFNTFASLKSQYKARNLELEFTTE